jgi:hypothetical protein
VTPPRGTANSNGNVPDKPTTPPPPPGHLVATNGHAQAIAELALRKAAAFDDLARWLTQQSGGAQYTDAMGPEWVVSTIKSRLASLLEDGRDFRAGRRLPTFRRRVGW